jgi:hypothetical protein
VAARPACGIVLARISNDKWRGPGCRAEPVTGKPLEEICGAGWSMPAALLDTPPSRSPALRRAVAGSEDHRREWAAQR